MQLNFLDQLDAPSPAVVAPPVKRLAAASPAEADPVPDPGRPRTPRESSTSKARASTTAPRTLIDVMVELQPSVCASKRSAAMRSALRTVGRVLQRPLDQLPADPAALAALMARAAPAGAGIGPRNWIQVCSLTRAALREAGVSVMPGRDCGGLGPAWREQADRLSDRRLQIGLSRLISYFSREGIGPPDVTVEAFERYHRALLTASLHAAPEATFRDTVRLWNLAVRTVPGWPALVIQLGPHPVHFSHPWASFPAAFVTEVESFLFSKANPDVFADDYSAPVRPATEKGRRKQLRQLATALVESGFDRSKLTSLTVLCQFENAGAALRYLQRRARAEKTATLEAHARLLRTIALYWLKDPELAARFKALASKLHTSKRRMTLKNRERLKQFDLPQNFDVLFDLPARILRQARRQPKGDVREAVRIMYATAVQILIFAPIRLKNLTDLEIGRHLIEVGQGASAFRKIVLPAESTKTNTDFEIPLPLEANTVLSPWLATYRKRACPHPSPYLFPNPRGQRRSDIAFAAKITRFIKRETGLVVNMHLFRHIAAKFYLELHPEGLETVRQLLGHTNSHTTARSYAEFKAAPAFKRYDDAVLDRSKSLGRVRRTQRGAA